MNLILEGISKITDKETDDTLDTFEEAGINLNQDQNLQLVDLVL